ncbi:MAG: AzlC family ABC transporter permease [Lachnospiraceae bacterium]|nr:AzlC family ABC transporter permease [Lachnospiraceae bacterium]
MKSENRTWFLQGMKDGIPIALGYFAVSLTLGITAKKAGLTALQSLLASLTNHASAGEFIGFTLIAAGASYLELCIMEAVANARYLLMSCSLSQKLPPDTSMLHRLLIGFFVTDEIFGVSISVPGRLNPFYTYGVISVASPGWVIGTYLGVILGNLLPMRAVSALGVGLYGMFIAVFIPPARKSRIVAGLVTISFCASLIFSKVPVFAQISSGIRIIILTLVISLTAAVLFPIEEEEEPAGQQEDTLTCKEGAS